jgi:hypothetical protein
MTVLGGRHVDRTGRATGRLRTNRYTGKIGGQFAWRLIEMLESPAYRVLTLSAHRVLSRIEVELGHHGGKENGHLPVTFQNFEDYGVHRHSIYPAIAEVTALGFVEITQRGRAGNGEWRAPNVFRLTYKPTDNAPPTDGWRQIKTAEEAEAIAEQARKTPPATRVRRTTPITNTNPPVPMRREAVGR